MPPLGPGGAAKIHAARAKKMRAELDRIDEALDQAKVAYFGDDEQETAARVTVALEELARLRQRVNDLEFEHGV